MNEFQLIQEYFASWQEVGPQPVLGIGDDAALVSIPQGKQLVVAADTIVEGRHFPATARPEQIASRALRVNLSDMAAMGARPLHYTLCLTLPQSKNDWLAAFAKNLRADSETFQCSLIGGDTTKGELCISLQMMGIVDTGKALVRSAAEAGHLIFVTGNLGDAAGFVAADFSSEAEFEPLASKFWSPEPRIDFAQKSLDFIAACIDVSDGLLADLGHICAASGVSAEVAIDRVPVSTELRASFPERALELALTGGDDYELCFTAPADQEESLSSVAKDCGLALTQIGRVVSTDGVEQNGVRCFDSKGLLIDRFNKNSGGYSHF